MTIHVLTGTLGAGKSMFAVQRMQEALLNGARIATNLELNLEYMVTPDKPRSYLKLPDFPTVDDLKACGLGYDGGKYDEKKFGLMVLDEAAMFLNSREWAGEAGVEKDVKQKQAKERAAVIKYFRMLRRMRWHLILIAQDMESLDAHIRRAICEHVVECRRADRFSLPILSWLTKLLGLGAVTMPQVHFALVYYGKVKVDTWFLWDAMLLRRAYRTDQRFTGDVDGVATMFDAKHAPYMWEPKGPREWLWKLARGLVPRSAARIRHDDFRLFRDGLAPPYRGHVGYSEWWLPLETALSMDRVIENERAGRPGALGGEAGEAPEPANQDLQQDAAD